MARRRRLEIPEGAGEAAPETKAFPLGVAPVRLTGAGGGAPPVSRVAGEAAAEAALAEVAGEMTAARAEGRMVVRLGLDAIDAGHIARDRQRLDAEAAAALETSIEAHGQRTPVEVVETAPGRYGLISGWRRLGALRALHARTGEDRFATVLALLRRPADAGAAYTAMVEENEIRADLGHWERAGIVIRTVEDGVFADEEAALSAMFGSVSRARRSKIRTFTGLHRRLGDALSFGPEMSERTGLALAQRIAAEGGFADALAARLSARRPASAAEEREAIDAALRETPGQGRSAPAAEGAGRPVEAPPVRVSGTGGRLVLEGPGVTPELRADLEAWLTARETP